MAEETHIKQFSNIATELHVELQVISSTEDFNTIRTEWRAFFDRPAVAAGFFTDPSVLEQNVDFKGGGCVVLGKVHHHNDLVAIIPLVLRKAPVPVRFGLISLFRPVCRVAKVPDFEFPREERVSPYEAFSVVLSAVRKQIRMADMVLVDSAPAPPPGQAVSTFTVGGIQTTYVVQIEGDFVTYEKKLSSNSRMKIKQRIRKLEKTFGASVQTICYSTPSEMKLLREQFTKVWEKSWHARVGGHNVPSERCLETLAQSGLIRAYVLVAADQPVASILGYQYRGTYYYEESAYNQDWRDYSPGTVLLYYALKDIFARDRPVRFDFGAGYNVYKQVFGTCEERRGHIRVGITMRGKLIVRLQAASDLIFKRSKAVMGKTGIPRLIKKKIRGET
ncbi:MAG: GNAT family N-acetyltransferase [Acidobacteriaceae bacterium]